MRENKFQSWVIEKLNAYFPGCVILKNDPNYIQGIPDILVLYQDRWAALEVKQSETAKHRPNQEFYISKLDEMSFARFVYPENEEEVFDELQQAFLG